MPPVNLPLIVGIGELLWDVFPDYRVPGGASGNFAFQAQQLGCRGMVVSSVGDDPEGEELVAYLQERGLETRGIQRDADHPTSKVTITLSGEGLPNFIIHEEVAWDYIRPAPALEEIMREAAAVCFGTLAQRHDVSRNTIQQAVEFTDPSCLRVYDVNLRQHYFQREWIEASAMKADIVKLNDDEVRTLAPILKFPSDEIEFARAMIENFGVRIVCMTRGPRGCLVVTADDVHDVPGRPVKVVDTVGAGDSFTAGLIVAQLREWPLALSCEFANRVGSLVSSRRGGMPDLREEFAQLIEQYSL